MSNGRQTTISFQEGWSCAKEAVEFFLKYGTGEENTAFIYNTYMEYLSGLLQNILRVESPEEDILDIVIEICKCEYTLQLITWEGFDKQKSEEKEQLFLDLLSWLVSLDEVADERMEAFCHAGELLSAVMKLGDEWVFFQKLRISFFIETGRVEEACIKISELDRILPDDRFISETKERMADTIQLDDISELSVYLDALKICLKRYMVFIASSDTPWGPDFSRELTHKLLELGLKVDLYQKYRRGYIAVIDCGKVVFEHLSEEGKEISWSGSLGGTEINLVSRSFGCYPRVAEMRVDGRNYPTAIRGLNIIIYNPEKNTVIDKVTFDTYVDDLTCSRPNKLRESLEKWHFEHPEIGLISFNLPSFPKKDLSSAERFIEKNKMTRGKTIEYIKYPELPLKAFFEKEEQIYEVLSVPESYHDISGIRKFKDVRGQLVNTIGGHRVTTDQPQESRRTIYILGGCLMFGIGASDKGTVASWLQRLCNEKAREEHIIVQNYGYYLMETDKKYMEEMRILQGLPLQPGDIVLCNWGCSPEIPFLDISKVSERPHELGELFFDTDHLNENGYRIVAEKLFERLSQEDFFRSLSQEYKKTTNGTVQAEKIDSVKTRMGKQEQNAENQVQPVMIEGNQSLEKYKQKLSDLYNDKFSVGAIVMNCNPFTLGHRYLIEQASNQCAHLIIFVVEEDVSCFAFQDRFELVKAGTKDLENVMVLPSGRFILSSLTFSEYFNKSELQDCVVDASSDVQLFGREIAPCLHISKRFIGDEPFDTVTQQYNNEMKKILPQYGVEVIQIKRLEQEDMEEVISASKVRMYIENGEFDSIKKMVPPSTYAYICRNFEELQERLRN